MCDGALNDNQGDHVTCFSSQDEGLMSDAGFFLSTVNAGGGYPRNARMPCNKLYSSPPKRRFNLLKPGWLSSAKGCVQHSLQWNQWVMHT